MRTPPDVPKGHRPQVFDDPAIDQLYAAYVALATELSVAFDRIDTLERLLMERTGLSPTAIEQYTPDAAATEIRAQRRADLAARLIKPFRDFRESRLARTASPSEPDHAAPERRTTS